MLGSWWRAPSRFLAFASCTALPALVTLVDCSALSGAPAGSQCFASVDCAAGLVCIEQGSSRICSSNIKSIETEIDSGVDAAPSDDGPIRVPEAAATTGESGTKPGDATTSDVVEPPPTDGGHDTGTGHDATTPPADTGPPPPVDAGHDAGQDAGHDAGQDSGHDGGEPDDDGGHDAKTD